MKKMFLSLPLCLVMGMANTAAAQSAAKDIHDEIEQTAKASTVFRAIMSGCFGRQVAWSQELDTPSRARLRPLRLRRLSPVSSSR